MARRWAYLVAQLKEAMLFPNEELPPTANAPPEGERDEKRVGTKERTLSDCEILLSRIRKNTTRIL